MELVEDGDLDVDEEAEFLGEGGEGAVAVWKGVSLGGLWFVGFCIPVTVSRRSLTLMAAFVGLVKPGSTLS